VVPLAIVVATAASYAIGWAVGIAALVPILNTLASFPFMVSALRRGQVRVAVSRMLIWALAMGVFATFAAYVRPWEAGQLFIRGDAYRAEMFTWVLTGRGPESTPSIFIPQQAGHAALFVALAWATGGAAAMPMGAVLMNYMGTYVGSLAAASSRPLLVAVLAWHPWAVIRVVSFVVLGVVLSMPVLSRIFRFRADWAAARPLIMASVTGLVIDVVLKSVAAPAWRNLLVRVTGF
jgi:hypothetical protein